jgi:hypothetical protein
MKTGNTQTFAEIERMGLAALRAGVKRKGIAPAFPRICDQPIEHRFAVSMRAMGFAGDEVIDIKRQARRKHVLDAESGDRDDLALVLEHGKQKALRDLLVDERDELRLRLDMEAKLPHHREAARDLLSRTGEMDRHCLPALRLAQVRDVREMMLRMPAVKLRSLVDRR